MGFAAAYYDSGAFVPGVMAAYAACACLVIAWLNLSNDAWVRTAACGVLRLLLRLPALATPRR